jgi:hypothetical protein
VASINSRQYPGLGRAQQNGCSDVLGLAQCASMCWTPGPSYRPSSSGVTQTVFRAQSLNLPCTSSKCLLGSGRGVPRGSLSVERVERLQGREHPPAKHPGSRRPYRIYRKLGYVPGPQLMNGYSSAACIRARQLDAARFTPRVLLSSRAIAGGLNLFRV